MVVPPYSLVYLWCAGQEREGLALIETTIVLQSCTAMYTLSMVVPLFSLDYLWFAGQEREGLALKEATITITMQN